MLRSLVKKTEATFNTRILRHSPLSKHSSLITPLSPLPFQRRYFLIFVFFQRTFIHKHKLFFTNVYQSPLLFICAVDWLGFNAIAENFDYLCMLLSFLFLLPSIYGVFLRHMAEKFCRKQRKKERIKKKHEKKSIKMIKKYTYKTYIIHGQKMFNYY